MTDCPICKECSERVLSRLYDDRYAYPGRFNVDCCQSCRHTFVTGTEGLPSGDHIYTEYYPRATFDPEKFAPKTFSSGFVSWLNGEACAACRWVPGEVRVLDIGCGFCETLAYHKAMGCEVRGVEADENVKVIADKFHFDVDIGLFDCDNYAPSSFDYVTMHQVVEHFEDPVQALKGVSFVLRRGGVAVITTPNVQGVGARIFGRKWINWHVPYHRHFFSKTSMRVAAQSAGMAVVDVRTITSSEWLRYQWTHLMAFPAEGEPSAFWSPYSERSLLIKIGQKLCDVLHYCKINHMLTRCFDGAGAGDNFVFILKKL